ncbi:glycosyltransferase family 4 protein [Pseudanabaena sp. PCC 6802]|uniref:glycosyltransferase family 4 protein n=1 Tax=Pseudanabaena sp. PCC 6802 TaxID=118173 RepID=UPI000349B40D|nr:glycosyltransferase family 4 protein [Pseudanabaena sp. PCC 6802]
MPFLSDLRVAVVHEWLVDYSGSERVLEQILLLFPQADLFALVDFLPPKLRGFIQNKSVRTSFIQKLPLARTKYRQYLPLMPIAVEQFDLSSYDLIISSSHAVAKGVLTGPDQLHISYVHSPIRYAWDLQHQYLKESGLDRGLQSAIARWFLHQIRIWDARTANGVDGFVANSQFIARRIRKVYRRESQVIYPPVDVAKFTPPDDALDTKQIPKEDFYLTASRFVPYKKVDSIVEAFSQIGDRRLVVIGDGPGLDKVRAKLSNNITLLGYQEPDVLKHYMQKARAFVFAAEEDFGITIVEAQACGTPVIAFGKGGALETVRAVNAVNVERAIEKPTGVFFYEQTAASIKAAIATFEQHQTQIDPEFCRTNALRFAPERFRQEFRDYIKQAWITRFDDRLGSHRT